MSEEILISYIDIPINVNKLIPQIKTPQSYKWNDFITSVSLSAINRNIRGVCVATLHDVRMQLMFNIFVKLEVSGERCRFQFEPFCFFFFVVGGWYKFCWVDLIRWEVFYHYFFDCLKFSKKKVGTRNALVNHLKLCSRFKIKKKLIVMLYFTDFPIRTTMWQVSYGIHHLFLKLLWGWLLVWV